MGRHYTPRCGSRSTRFCESGAGAQRRRSRPARRRDRTACRRQRRVPLRLAATSTLGSLWALLCPGSGPGSLHWGGGGAYGLLDVSIYTKKVENRRSHACGRLRAHDAPGCAAAAAPRRLDARPRRHHAHTVQSADSGCRLYRSSGQISASGWWQCSCRTRGCVFECWTGVRLRACRSLRALVPVPLSGVRSCASPQRPV